MQVNKLDYLYRTLVIKSREQYNETVDITDEEYTKYYVTEPEQVDPIPGSDIPIPGEDENDLTINTNANNNKLIPELGRLEFPKIKDDENNLIIIHKTNDNCALDGINYSLEWDCNKKAPRWVCYQFTSSSSIVYYDPYTSSGQPWMEDPDIPEYARFSSTWSIYMDSGFDRGHLVSVQDRRYSKEANDQVWYYSNVLPMYNNFNAGVWADLEKRLRSWNTYSFRDILFIVKGGTIDREDQILTRIKPDVEGGLIVPKYFFMAILAKSRNFNDSYGYSAIGFWVEHNNNKNYDKDLRNYVVNISTLEQLTGIDFFCNLPDIIEEQIKNKSLNEIFNDFGFE